MSDTIYREDAIKVIKDNSFAPGVDYLEINGYGAIDDIRALPSVDIPQGEWIDAEIRHEDGVLPIQVCSECKTFYPLEYTGGGHRYCPNCGARMKGADDDRI